MQVRRLAAILGILGLPVHALHAGMQQRQRLTALDRFRSNPDGVLVATDVAARGLDIPVRLAPHKPCTVKRQQCTAHCPTQCSIASSAQRFLCRWFQCCDPGQTLPTLVSGLFAASADSARDCPSAQVLQVDRLSTNDTRPGMQEVATVVHYQLAASADMYVHRSGRTGRAGAEGASIVLVTPAEAHRFAALLAVRPLLLSASRMPESA